MGVLEDMLRNHASGKSHLRFIEVIWSISDPGKRMNHGTFIFSFLDPLELTGNHESDSLYSLLPELTPLMRPRASYHSSLSLRFNVHWTRVSSYHPPRVPHTTLPTGMYIQSGRPDIFNALQSVIAGVRSSFYWTGWNDDPRADLPRGIVVGSCGPTALMDDAAQAVGRVSWTDWKDVGGVENVEECVCRFLILSLLLPCMLTGYRTGALGGKNPPFIFILFFLSVVAG
jgi:ferric-chelate reductase